MKLLLLFTILCVNSTYGEVPSSSKLPLRESQSKSIQVKGHRMKGRQLPVHARGGLFWSWFEVSVKLLTRLAIIILVGAILGGGIERWAESKKLFWHKHDSPNSTITGAMMSIIFGVIVVLVKSLYDGIGCEVDYLFAYFDYQGWGVHMVNGAVRGVVGQVIFLTISSLLQAHHSKANFLFVSSIVFVLNAYDVVGSGIDYLLTSLDEQSDGVKEEGASWDLGGSGLRRVVKFVLRGIVVMLLGRFCIATIDSNDRVKLGIWWGKNDDMQLGALIGVLVLLSLYIYDGVGTLVEGCFASADRKGVQSTTSHASFEKNYKVLIA